MNNKIIITLAIFIGSLFCFGAVAQEEDPQPIGNKQKKELIDTITSPYYEWESLSMSGKLSSPMLPVTASVKVYMERGELVVISLSAPLVGEAARIEIDKDQALVVNKLNNTYTTVAMAEIEQVCPGGIDVVQNLMLGRVTLAESGLLTSKDSKKLDIYDAAPDVWMLLPKQDLENAPFVYLYNINKPTLKLQRFLVIAQKENGVADFNYSWGKKDTTISMMAELGGGELSGTLKLNTPDNTPKKISRIEITSKYRKTNLSGVLRM